MNILPADTYIVINKTILDDKTRKIITMLYQPIIGYQAVSLFFTLIDDLDRLENSSVELTHYHLMSIMQLKLETIVESREKLEAVGLLKTYFREDHINNYIYQLFSPLSPNEFINHPILGVVLYNNVGKSEYQNIINYFKSPKYNLSLYNEITKKFDEVFKSVPSKTSVIELDDIKSESKSTILLNHSIDFNLLINSIPKGILQENAFNNDIKSLINNLSYTYDIDDLHMQGLIRDSINEKGLIDRQLLKKNARNFYEFDNGGNLPTLIYTTQPDYLKRPKGDNSNWAKMVYTFETVTPYDYLKSKYGGVEPSSRDLRLIEYLLDDMRLPAGVVNVLIAYVLKINNSKLNKAYVETIAGQWKRLKIETVDEAMKVSSREHKKMKKKIETSINTPNAKTKKEVSEAVPDWFNMDLDANDISKEEQEELDKLLNKI